MFLSVNKEFHSIFQAFQICENVEKQKRMADVTATIYFKKKNKKRLSFLKTIKSGDGSFGKYY